MPCPGSLRTSMLPPNASTWSLTASSPTPRPGDLADLARGREAGRASTSASEPRPARLGERLLRDAAAVVGDRDLDDAAALLGAQLEAPARRLAGAARAPRAARSRGRPRCGAGGRAARRGPRGSRGRARSRRPSTTSSTCLPVSAARSRTARGSGVTIDESGSVRIPIAAPLRSSSRRSPRSSSSVTTPCRRGRRRRARARAGGGAARSRRRGRAACRSSRRGRGSSGSRPRAPGWRLAGSSGVVRARRRSRCRAPLAATSSAISAEVRLAARPRRAGAARRRRAAAGRCSSAASAPLLARVRRARPP